VHNQSQDVLEILENGNQQSAVEAESVNGLSLEEVQGLIHLHVGVCGICVLCQIFVLNWATFVLYCLALLCFCSVCVLFLFCFCFNLFCFSF